MLSGAVMAKNIKEVMLGGNDLPRGFKLDELVEPDKRTLAQWRRDPDAELKLLEQFGRITGYRQRLASQETQSRRTILYARYRCIKMCAERRLRRKIRKQI